MTFDGDILIQTNDDGDLDIVFRNGQPDMTSGFNTCVLLAVFGEDCPQNGMGVSASERYNSTFPSVVRRALVSDETRQDGEKALEKALAFMVTERIASSVGVVGRILSARSIGWEITITSPNGVTKYSINWDKGMREASISGGI